MNYPNPKDNPARQALTRAVDKAIAEGAPIYVNQPAPVRAAVRIYDDLDFATGVEDALDCMNRGLTGKEYVDCVTVEHQTENAEWWKAAGELVNEFGSWRRASNEIERSLEYHRTK